MPISYNKIKFNKSESIIFLLGIVISLLAKGAALFPLSYSIDDYARIIQPVDIKFLLSQGRFGEVLVKEFLQTLGAVPPLTNTFLVFAGLLSIILVGIVVCRLWKISENIILGFLIVSFIAIHPYQAEIFTFKTASLFGPSLLISFIGLYFSELRIKTILWTTLSVVVALSIYQIVLNYLFLYITTYMIAHNLRSVSLGLLHA